MNSYRHGKVLAMTMLWIGIAGPAFASIGAEVAVSTARRPALDRTQVAQADTRSVRERFRAWLFETDDATTTDTSSTAAPPAPAVPPTAAPAPRPAPTNTGGTGSRGSPSPSCQRFPNLC